jgi:hypothetical protein
MEQSAKVHIPALLLTDKLLNLFLDFLIYNMRMIIVTYCKELLLRLSELLQVKCLKQCLHRAGDIY